MTTISLDELASELDVRVSTVETLVGQLADDSDLFDIDSGSLTPAGADIVRAQIGANDDADELLNLAFDFRQAATDLAEAKQRRTHAVRKARAWGASWAQIADAFELGSRSAAQRIAGESR